MSNCDYCQSVLEDGTLCTLCGPRPNVTCPECRQGYHSKGKGKCPVCGLVWDDSVSQPNK